jgi:gamma-glutamylputrescine oxidase
VGGGMAGLTAAQGFVQKGLRVVLLEKHFCGAGATGKSSGFITPNSELSLSDLSNFYGLTEAQKIWSFVQGGVEHIRKNILEHDFTCDYKPEDTLVVANSMRAFKKIIMPEYETRQKLGYASTLYQTSGQVSQVLGSTGYAAGIAYADSFGIDAYRYCGAMKQMLQSKGVLVYEDTPVLAIKDHRVITPFAEVKAQHVVVCMDRFLPDLDILTKEVYHAQTCLMLSAPLTDAEIARIFPTKQYMVWDTELIYNYFRLSGDNRLMIGGSNFFSTYASKENYHNTCVINHLRNYWHTKFPDISVNFEYAWPGLIGISKDLMPIAGHDNTMPSVFYVAAAAGLPWAAALGMHSVNAVLDGDRSFEAYFSPYRSFPIGSFAHSILGNKISFALSNFMRTGSI